MSPSPSSTTLSSSPHSSSKYADSQISIHNSPSFNNAETHSVSKFQTVQHNHSSTSQTRTANVTIDRTAQPTSQQQSQTASSKSEKLDTAVVKELEELLVRLDKEIKMKAGVENMLEVYIKDKKRTKELEAQLDVYNTAIDHTTKRIDHIRTSAVNSGTNIIEVARLLKTYKYTGTSFSDAITPSALVQTRSKLRSNKDHLKGKENANIENVSYPYDDAWPLDQRLKHILENLEVDEWKIIDGKDNGEPSQKTLDSIKDTKLEKLETLIRILKNTTGIEAHCSKNSLIKGLRRCIVSPYREIRLQGLRALRLLVEGPNDVQQIMAFQIDIFCVRALARDPEKSEPEREQTLKLIRAFIEYGGVKHLNQNIVRSIVAIAEQQDARLRNIALETLAELTILNVALTVRSGGLRVLLQALIDGQQGISEVLIQAVLYVLDTPDKRCYLRPGVELEIIIAPFTEPGSGTSHEERLKNSARMVITLIKNWAGIFYMSANNMRAARSVVQALRMPVPETQKLVLDMFFEIFRTKLPKDHQGYLSGRQHTIQMAPATHTEPEKSSSSGPLTLLHGPVMTNLMTAGGINPDSYARCTSQRGATTASNSERLKMLDHHLSIIIIIFIESDILMALVDMVKSDDIYMSRKATLLIGEILQLSTRHLPIMMAIQVQSLPKLFSLASNFEDEQVRHNATAALAHIDRLTRARARYMASIRETPSLTSSTSSSFIINAYKGSSGNNERLLNTIAAPPKRTQEKVHEVKLKIGYAIDDTHFRQLLMDSQVLNTKDHTKWNWDSIIELLQGPLLNPRRLEEAMRGKKFIKRLLAFYRPFKHQFSDMNATKGTIHRYVKTGCTLLSIILSNPDGVRYLSENKLLQDIANAFNELDPLLMLQQSSLSSKAAGSGGGDDTRKETEPIFSKERMENTLTCGYFALLGTISKYKEGVRIMERFKIFSCFYHISELKNRTDLKVAMITNLDYTLDGHPRVLLSKIMTSGYNPIRLFATQHIGVIMRQSEAECNDWVIRLLVTQLYDTNLEVCQTAVQLLDEACQKQANLELLVRYRPSLGHLGEIGNPLLLRFLSTSTGFRYLNALGYVQKEMDDWFERGNQNYVTQLEISLARALANTPEKKAFNPFEERVDSENDFEMLQPGDGLSPPHFYGELTKTEEGCNLLREKGHFRLFADYVRNSSSNKFKESDTSLSQLKAVLWALGNIGATKNGLPFLEEENVIKDIVEMAETSEILSLKGTCYFVLGLIAKTQQGVELLSEFGWESVVSSNMEPEGLCVPINLCRFLTIQNWTYKPALSASPQLPRSATTDAIASDILKHTGDMSNHILANEASKNLARLRHLYPESFKRIDLYYSVCQLLGSYHFRSTVRKYILEIFDVKFTSESLAELDELSVMKTNTTATISTSDTNNDTTAEQPNIHPTPNDEDSVENPSIPPIPVLNKNAVTQEKLDSPDKATRI
ncbi:Rapamycin-insensitive companion of mTOR, N-term-domain-containing protein [Mycotypha africana]|uniref:Rapamycin-insensitive companion of mTOR, N-term-domain-containing protein n=1 Tax=Mycotypha africana TaxID=64632 RepID=UPI00230109E5|nr:Rapamycin-insensitive companion of mTOR, N-term-domain-containing protein [Mycotypha africana]KAI8987675.1 Rapamycin-insensitive companion of mTOR, N-term-domain-containing protein [Mycotypha africana]